MDNIIKLFFSPIGWVSRQQFWLACLVFVLVYFLLIYVIDLSSMRGFWMGFIFVPALFYSAYQVMKKRLKHMGYSSRPIWMWMFLLLILFVGLAIYFGWGEYFNVMFDNEDKHTDQAWIQAQEKILQESLAKGRSVTRVLISIPCIVFIAWLAFIPGQNERSEKQS